jgi:hypothetical protein
VTWQGLKDARLRGSVARNRGDGTYDIKYRYGGETMTAKMVRRSKISAHHPSRTSRPRMLKWR